MVCDCGMPWTFLLTFFQTSVCVIFSHTLIKCYFNLFQSVFLIEDVRDDKQQSKRKVVTTGTTCIKL